MKCFQDGMLIIYSVKTVLIVLGLDLVQYWSIDCVVEYILKWKTEIPDILKFPPLVSFWCRLLSFLRKCILIVLSMCVSWS
jgi:hypothetical protein